MSDNIPVSLRVYSHNDRNTISPAYPTNAPKRVVLHGRVVELLTFARHLDLTVDQPYMPFPNTFLMEAVGFLRANDHILVEGGRIDYIMGNFNLTSLARGTHSIISHLEVRHLLKANYPSKVVKVRPISDSSILPQSNISSNTIQATHAASPVMSEDFALLGQGVLNTSLDDLNSLPWNLTYVLPTGTEKYIGQITSTEILFNVWWSDADSCFYAQSVLPPEDY